MDTKYPSDWLLLRLGQHLQSSCESSSYLNIIKSNINTHPNQQQIQILYSHTRHLQLRIIDWVLFLYFILMILRNRTVLSKKYLGTEIILVIIYFPLIVSKTNQQAYSSKQQYLIILVPQMNRQKMQIQPINLQSPQDNLCQISMLADQTELISQNYKTPYIGTNKSYRFDGWVKLQTKNDQKFKGYRSHIIQNKPIKHEEPIHRYLASRFTHKRNISNEQNINTTKRSTDDLQSMRARSFDIINDLNSFTHQESSQMYHSSYFNQSLNNIRKNMINSRQGTRFEKQINPKIQIGSVTYPILQLGVSDPQKRYMFHIGRVRRLINNKNKRK